MFKFKANIVIARGLLVLALSSIILFTGIACGKAGAKSAASAPWAKGGSEYDFRVKKCINAGSAGGRLEDRTATVVFVEVRNTSNKRTGVERNSFVGLDKNGKSLHNDSMTVVVENSTNYAQLTPSASAELALIFVGQSKATSLSTKMKGAATVQLSSCNRGSVKFG